MIGRANAAEAIARFTRSVPDGPVGLVIEGEPGIGKTTVWLEAVRMAGELGYLVLKAKPTEAEVDLSFAALGDLLGGVLDDVRDALPPPQRVALEVALLRRDAEMPADPLTTATALVSVLTILSRRDPLVIAIDDAPWLDRASMRVLEFALRRLPSRTGILVARRAGEDAAALLGLDRALAAGRLEHLALGPMSVAALHQLMQSRFGMAPPRPTLVRVAEASRGNPFYALEIATAMERSGATPALGDPLPVPPDLRDLLSDRMDLLSAGARAAASVAAALSHPTTASVAAALDPDVDAEAALLEAEEEGILVSDGDRLRFSHPLLASTIYGSFTGARRRSLHRRLAVVVGDPEEAARHLARSATDTDERTASRIEEAAGLADRRGAPEAAAELYEAAGRLTPEGNVYDLARRMLGGAHALNRAGDLDGARSLATKASDMAPAGPVRARSLLLLGTLATYTDTIEQRVAYQERALAEAGDDAGLRVRILLALFEQIGADAGKAARRADGAIELLRAQADRSLLAPALVRKLVAEALLGHGAQTELLDEALRLEAAFGPVADKYPLLWFHWIDDLAATRERYRLHEEEYRERGDTVGTSEIGEFLAMPEFRAGHWDLAEELLEDACAGLAELDVRGPAAASLADRSVIDAHRGRFERARGTVVRILEDDRLDVMWRMVCHSAQGAVEFCGGDHEAADRAWAAMRAEAEQISWYDNLEDRSEPDHVEALLALGRLDDARRILEHLEWRGRTLPRAWIEATLPRARALVLAGQGDPGAAIAMLDAAPEVVSLPFERARLLMVRGQIGRRANRRLAAKDDLTQALAIFEALGSPPWAARTRAELERLGLRHRATDELTDGERRIAELAAAGLTNRQVADAAFVSPKTVESNLIRVYRKLGIRSRAELGARMATRSGDVGTEA